MPTVDCARNLHVHLQGAELTGNRQFYTATVTLIFPAGSGLAVTVVDGHDKTTAITDYRWIIEEDRTFYVDPNCTTNPPPAGCPYREAESCRPLGPTSTPATCRSWQQAAPDRCPAKQARPSWSGCGVRYRQWRLLQAPTPMQETAVDPSQVVLDPTKRYYISVLPGDAANPFETGNAEHGPRHGRRSDAAGQTAVTVLAQAHSLPARRNSRSLCSRTTSR